MPLALYADQHIPRAVTAGLRLRHVDVLTAFEDGAAEPGDPDHLDRASALHRILFSQDDDLPAEARRRQLAHVPFAGVVYAHPPRVSIGTCVRALVSGAGQHSVGDRARCWVRCSLPWTTSTALAAN